MQFNKVVLSMNYTSPRVSLVSPADLSGRLVEPGAHSLLPVFMKVRVQDHAIPAGSHDCSLLE